MDDFLLSETTRARLDREGQEFLVAFYQKAFDRHPDNLAALSELGHALTRLGRNEEGLAADERLVALAPENATVHYNHACSLALMGRIDEAFSALERAVTLGYADVQHLVDDEDLLALHQDARFQTLVERLRQG